ncbi:MAG: DUF1015 domain-containing protein, partial [Chloroflexi bacterium]|nr:DUF1015 domain-containing protein [Chloroflexota bacterium]
MPTLRPFRALRYALEAEADLSALICPPYDVISADQRARLESRHPHNAVHLELPAPAAESAHAGSEAASPYLRAARDFVAWRTQGVLRKDPRPAIYAYEQVYRQTGEPDDRRLRGFFARLRLEVAGPDSGVRPHERTLSGPKEDRYRLLRACGANFSPVVMLFGSGRRSQPLLEAACRGQPTANALDDTGVRHRLWRLEAPSGKDPEDPNALVGERLLALGQAGPLVIADGHHRYETALRYRDERGERRACESDPAYDYVLALLFDLDDPALAVLATHRLVRGGPVGEGLLKAADELFEVRPLAGRHELIAAFPPG